VDSSCDPRLRNASGRPEFTDTASRPLREIRVSSLSAIKASRRPEKKWRRHARTYVIHVFALTYYARQAREEERETWSCQRIIGIIDSSRCNSNKVEYTAYREDLNLEAESGRALWKPARFNILLLDEFSFAKTRTRPTYPIQCTIKIHRIGRNFLKPSGIRIYSEF